MSVEDRGFVEDRGKPGTDERTSVCGLLTIES